MSEALSTRHLTLVRHSQVAENYLGICYGRSDVPLRSDSHQEHDRIVGELNQVMPTVIIHSGLDRTRLLAERLAKEYGCEAIACPDVRERDFGSWELQSWDAIYKQHGDDMMRMLTEPDGYRPGGGETTFELRDRMVGWYESLPLKGSIIAVTHGGPIAALLGTLRRLPVESWVSLIPACGQWVTVPRRSPELV